MLEAHGWGELQSDLIALSKQGRWMELSERIDLYLFGTHVAERLRISHEPSNSQRAKIVLGLELLRNPSQAFDGDRVTMRGLHASAKASRPPS